MLAPYAPHMAEELWSKFSGEGSIHNTTWPAYDAGKVITGTVKMAVQVNGKMRGVIEVTPDESEEAIQQKALADEKVKAAIGGQEIKKIIIIPQKIVSIVV
jgi:leucyl-tRNA synthetase